MRNYLFIWYKIYLKLKCYLRESIFRYKIYLKLKCYRFTYSCLIMSGHPKNLSYWLPPIWRSNQVKPVDSLDSFPPVSSTPFVTFHKKKVQHRWKLPTAFLRHIGSLKKIHNALISNVQFQFPAFQLPFYENLRKVLNFTSNVEAFIEWKLLGQLGFEQKRRYLR